MHEVEALVAQAFEEPRLGRRNNGVPAHVRNRGGAQCRDSSWPLTEPLGHLAALFAALEEHLLAHANAEHGKTTGEAPVDELVTAYGSEGIHDRVESAHTGNQESIGGEHGIAISSEFDAGARSFDGLRRRVNVSRAVVEHHYARGCGAQSAPFVYGMPCTR